MKSSLRKYCFIVSLAMVFQLAIAEDGYDLWMRYSPIPDSLRTQLLQTIFSTIRLDTKAPNYNAITYELTLAAGNMLSVTPVFMPITDAQGAMVIGTTKNQMVKSLVANSLSDTLPPDAFIIKRRTAGARPQLILASNTETGCLYATYALLRYLQLHNALPQADIVDYPRVQNRILNHWDNLNGNVERGYAGKSLWKWFELPECKDNLRYRDYARANASVGINGSVLNNVNASPLSLSAAYLEKTAALANVFRPYGIRVFLSVNFASPMGLGGLPTADPLDPAVIQWWQTKVSEIYNLIPDFGGFLVKANSEGLPGPLDYGRSHADGANMLAAALAPHNGIVMWRAFVYKPGNTDRALQGYNEFVPLDGTFAPNVLIQVKNGPVDFQPREPFHPLFGALPKTPTMPEFQITQEYLGFATHLAYLAPLYTECLNADTYTRGKGSQVYKLIEGKIYKYPITGMAGVANIGADRNWCGHPMAAANWYAFGRLAWNASLTADTIALEWISQTFTMPPQASATMLQIMMQSREAVVNYMTPLGLHHLMGWHHHYGPQPWLSEAARPDWNSVYYHKADSSGIGFNRTVATGSGAIGAYNKEVQNIFENIHTCPDNLLLWFHHVPWTYKLTSGHILWNELCLKYQSGVDSVKKMQQAWTSLAAYIDHERYTDVSERLAIQLREAMWWKDACLLYFQTFSKMPFPEAIEKPKNNIEYYMNIHWKYAPGVE